MDFILLLAKLYAYSKKITITTYIRRYNSKVIRCGVQRFYGGQMEGAHCTLFTIFLLHSFGDVLYFTEEMLHYRKKMHFI